MDLAVEEVSNGVTKVVLGGRIDTTRAVLIELPFNSLAAEKRAIVVDLTSAEFLSSYGLRVLLMGAKITNSKGGKLAIVCADNNVAKVLRTSGGSDLIPVFPSQDAAVAAVAPRA
jgi:anti-sigma B factor antagonist